MYARLHIHYSPNPQRDQASAQDRCCHRPGTGRSWSNAQQWCTPWHLVCLSDDFHDGVVDLTFLSKVNEDDVGRSAPFYDAVFHSCSYAARPSQVVGLINVVCVRDEEVEVAHDHAVVQVVVGHVQPFLTIGPRSIGRSMGRTGGSCCR